MNWAHSSWFWIAIIAAPLVTVVGTLARLARKEPPIKLPPGVVPQPWQDEDEQENEAATAHPAAAKPSSAAKPDEPSGGR